MSKGALQKVSASLRANAILREGVFRTRDVCTRLIERRLGINTTSPRGKRYDLATKMADPVPYEATDYFLLRKYIRPLHLKPDDVVYDIGCGMGRMLCLFARRNIKQCIGIEHDAELAQIARTNADRLRGRRAPIEVRTGDAILADYSQATVIWMFNPFGAATMRHVLDNIGASLEQRPRQIQIAYINPQQEDLFRSHRWLTKAGEAHSLLFTKYHASYWLATP
jgi:precorrin-6B methylase 2